MKEVGDCKFVGDFIYLTKSLQAALLNRPPRVRSGRAGIPLVRPVAPGRTTGCLYFAWYSGKPRYVLWTSQYDVVTWK